MNFENCIGYRRPRQMIVPHTFTVSHDAFSSRICLRVESGKEFRFFVSRRLLPSCLFSFLIWFCQFNAIGRFIAAHTQQFCLSERRCVECRIMFVRARCTVSTTTQWNAFFLIWRRKKGGNTWHAHVFLSFIDSSCFFLYFVVAGEHWTAVLYYAALFSEIFIYSHRETYGFVFLFTVISSNAFFPHFNLDDL